MQKTIQAAPISMRCPQCGMANAAEASLCAACGTDMPLFQIPPTEQVPFLPDTAGWSKNGPSGNECTVPAAKTSTSIESAVSPVLRCFKRFSQPELVGRVILMDSPYQEKPDFDWCCFANKLLWFLLLLASPFLLVHAVLVKLGALPALLAVGAGIYLLRFVTPSNLFAVLQMHFILSPFRNRDRELVPVRYFRIRDESEEEWTVRLKGNVRIGNISTDDLVSLHGKWRGGVLFARRGYNHRTRSRIDFHRTNSWIGLVATLGIILFLIAWFWEPTRILINKMHELRGQQ